LVAIGGEPNDSLARQAGLACADGVLVDEHCRTSDPRIYAIGDCASAWRETLGRQARVESVQNALAQARIAAAHIAGKPPLPRRTATFWSEQQGRRLQMAGLVAAGAACRDVVLSTPKGWVVERHLDGRLAAIEAVDSPAEFVKGVARLSAPPQLQET
ncbi:FAD-dependent oxidoreductase, partial [Bordetella pseudohinzii]